MVCKMGALKMQDWKMTDESAGQPGYAPGDGLMAWFFTLPGRRRAAGLSELALGSHRTNV